MARCPEKRSSQRFSDEELEYYGELYLSRPIRHAGVDFASFLSNPDYYLVKYHRKDRGRDTQDDGGTRKSLRDRLRLRVVSRRSD